MPTDKEENKGYVIDPESGAEMARLLIQDRLLTKGMGGVFPKDLDLTQVQRILDIGCGPGGWTLEVAQHYPHIQVVGIDISQAMIEYANAQAQVQGLHNVQFLVMDATAPLNFPDASFDLVNGRILTGFLSTEDWPKLLKECFRITRPKGIIHISEPEYGFTNSPALDALTGLMTKGLKQTNHSFSPHGRTFGTAPLLRLLFRQTGYTDIKQSAHVIDYSSDTELHDSNFQNLQAVYKLLQPFFVSIGLTTQEEVEKLYQQLLVEVQQDDFCGIDYYLGVWARKLEA